MSRRVLITGCRGFTGRHLIPLLMSRGFDVIGLEHTPATAPLSTPEVVCDLNDTARLQQVVQEIQPTHVIHLAAISFVGHANEEDFYRVNLFGTLNLLAALEKLPAKPEKTIIASSANVYGAPIGIEVLDETVAPGPVNHYANSKLAMEHMVRTWFPRLPIILTRPFNYTGPGQSEHFVIPKIVGHFKRREKRVELGNIRVSRDFSDVRDVVRCYADLLTAPVHSTVLNICSGTATSLEQVISHMNQLAGYAIEVTVNPRFVRANEIPRLLGSNERLRQAIGFAPAIPIETTLADMFTS